MPGLTPDRLRKWADELEAEEKADLDAAERERIEELAAAPRLTEEEVAWLRDMRAEVERHADGDHEKPDDPPADDPPADDPPADDPPADDPPRARTRPGRKSGSAYDFTVDADGNVVRDGVTYVYTGEDEPDRVELPAPREAEAA